MASDSDEELAVEGNDDGDFFFEGTPPDLVEDANSARSHIIPNKSRERYMNAYNEFCSWKKKNRVKSSSERVLLAYFKQLSEKKKPSSLWSTYSMLKQTLKVFDKVNIKPYAELSGFLSQHSKGYTAKKSKVLSEEETSKFLREASDHDWLDVKVS